MRLVLALAAAVLLVAVPFPVHAQDAVLPSAAPVQLATDPPGDVQAATPAGGEPLPSSVYPTVDLTSLSVAEDVDAFHVTIGLAAVHMGSSDAGDDGTYLAATFRHGTREFALEVVHQYNPAYEYTAAALSYRDPGAADWSNLWFHEGGVAADTAANTYTVDVPRADLADANGAPPGPGRTLDGFHVISSNAFGTANFGFLVANAQFPAAVDQMPDAGNATTSYAVRLGLAQDGHARLSSLEPYRASNGEATTYLFTVTAHNLGDHADSFALRAARLPTGWSVSFPQPTVDLEAGAQADLGVLVNVPFNHVHGAAASFVLELPSDSDPGTVGRVELGVRYLAIPQPAGHHNTLWFHTIAYSQTTQAFGNVFYGNDGSIFMDAKPDFDGDTQTAVSPVGNGFGPVVNDSWCIPLDPGLQMGLAFQSGGLGNISVPLHIPGYLKGAQLAAQLILTPPGQSGQYACYQGDPSTRKVLAALDGTTPADVGPNADHTFTGPMTLTGDATRIPYLKGQNLALLVTLSAVGTETGTAATAPKLAPGGQLQLPLLEYHEDVKGTLAAATDLPVTVLTAQTRDANPGGLVDFPLSIANSGESARHVAFNVTGSNAAWTTAPAAADVASHGTGQADLLVHVPATAHAGDQADLVVRVYDTANATTSTLVRLVVNVVTDHTVADDVGAPAQAPKKSPSVAVPAALGVLAALAMVARRRRAA